MTSSVQILALFATFVLLSILVPQKADAVPYGLPAGVWSEDIINNVGIVSDFEFLAPDKVAVVRKNGLISVYRNYGGYWGFQNTLIDLRDQVVDYGDRGAMGILKHPNYPATPYVYISTVFNENRWNPAGWQQNRLTRYSVYGDFADWGSAVILIGKCNNKVNGWYGGDCSPMLGTTHSIGWMGFGNDGMLYGGFRAIQLVLAIASYSTVCSSRRRRGSDSRRPGLDATRRHDPDLLAAFHGSELPWWKDPPYQPRKRTRARFQPVLGREPGLVSFSRLERRPEEPVQVQLYARRRPGYLRRCWVVSDGMGRGQLSRI
jgi:hypothetical protein